MSLGMELSVLINNHGTERMVNSPGTVQCNDVHNVHNDTVMIIVIR